MQARMNIGGQEPPQTQSDRSTLALRRNGQAAGFTLEAGRGPVVAGADNGTGRGRRLLRRVAQAYGDQFSAPPAMAALVQWPKPS